MGFCQHYFLVTGNFCVSQAETFSTSFTQLWFRPYITSLLPRTVSPPTASGKRPARKAPPPWRGSLFLESLPSRGANLCGTRSCPAHCPISAPATTHTKNASALLSAGQLQSLAQARHLLQEALANTLSPLDVPLLGVPTAPFFQHLPRIMATSAFSLSQSRHLGASPTTWSVITVPAAIFLPPSFRSLP